MRVVRISQKWQIVNWNVTTKVMEVFQSPKGRLAQIELLVCLAAFLLIFLEVFGAYRRRCNNGMFRAILWTAYTIPPYLITYTVGLMNAASIGNVLFPIWATFLILLLGSADSISAYTLADNEQWKRCILQFFAQLMGLYLLLTMYAGKSVLMFAIVFLAMFLPSKIEDRARASMLASRNVLQKNTKLIAEYMNREHLNSNQDEVDPISMSGYTYLVRGEEENWIQTYPSQRKSSKEMKRAEAPRYHVPFEEEAEVITVEKVWQCQGRLLRVRDSDHHIKDICLSFALFKILSLRFVGYSMPREAYEKSWKLFQKIITCGEDGYERAFRIIEVELALVFDQFYTKYQVILEPYHWMLKCIELTFVIIGSSIVASSILGHQEPDAAVSNGIDVLVTAVVIITYLILEILQVLFMSISEWGKVVWICNYVKKVSWQKNRYMEKLVEVICHINSLKPWERKLQQYTLLESYGYRPSLLLYNRATALFMDQARDGQNQSAPTKLSNEVKSAVISSLVTNGARLENGKASLSRNDMPMLLWACDLETQAQVIMVWHIATSMCEYEFHAKSDTVSLGNLKIATNLSKYLAYLVAFAPRLLPDHPYIAEYVFDQVIIEARDTFMDCNDLGDKITKLKNIGSHEGGETVIARGARLWKQLIDDAANSEIIWKVLADFWVELMAYVAPLDDMTAHLEHLAMGGEFVTHIWALLSHSGIGRNPG